MNWLQRYRIRHYLANSIWILPLLGIVAALATVRCLRWVDSVLSETWDYNPDTARAVLGTMASSMFTFIVFVSSALLVAVQLASAQLTPRIIAMVFGDPVTKCCLTVFVFDFTLTLAVLVQIDTSVPPTTVRVAAYSFLGSLVAFLYLIDHVGKTLRPSGAMRSVAALGRHVIEQVYPRFLAEIPEQSWDAVDAAFGEPVGTILNRRDGVILACDVEGLVAMAQQANCIVEMVPQVGDFVAAGDPLFRVYRGGSLRPAVTWHQYVAVGQERTLEQDPTFARHAGGSD